MRLHLLYDFLPNASGHGSSCDHKEFLSHVFPLSLSNPRAFTRPTVSSLLVITVSVSIFLLLCRLHTFSEDCGFVSCCDNILVMKLSLFPTFEFYVFVGE